VCVDDGDVARPSERHVADQALVEEASERVDVSAAVHLGAPDLLRRDVVDRSHDLPRIGDAAIRGAGAQPEVREVAVLLAWTPGEEDVRRLDVAVHEPALVRGVERARDLADEHQRSLRCESAFRPQQRLQVGARHVAHGDVEQPVDLAGLVYRDDVRVIERSRKPGLAQEACAKAPVLGEFGRQELESNVPFEPGVVSEVDDAHSPAPQHALDAVARELGADPVLGYDRHVSRLRRRSHLD
jgi:hypothetical protein